MKYKKIERKEDINLQLQNNKKLQKLKEKGITLIALVVTIVLLLILVGVTISQITGENGLIRKAKEAVERYKNASEEELIELGQLEQYVSDFEIIGGDEGEEKLVSIKENGLEVTGNVNDKTITVKVTVIGEASGVEYKISSKEEWTERENEGIVKEGTEGDQKETEYTHIFEGLDLGKSYYIRVKVYDTNNKYIEAISDVVTLNYIMTAEDEDVLEQETYLTEEGTLRTGTMPNKGTVDQTLNAEGTYTVEPGYYSGGEIKAKDLASQTNGTAGAGDILAGKTAYVKGKSVTGSMTDNSGKTVTTDTVTTDRDNIFLKIPNAGYFNESSMIKCMKSYFINPSEYRFGIVGTSWCYGDIDLNLKGINKVIVSYEKLMPDANYENINCRLICDDIGYNQVLIFNGSEISFDTSKIDSWCYMSCGFYGSSEKGQTLKIKLKYVR